MSFSLEQSGKPVTMMLAQFKNNDKNLTVLTITCYNEYLKPSHNHDLTMLVPLLCNFLAPELDILEMMAPLPEIYKQFQTLIACVWIGQNVEELPLICRYHDDLYLDTN